MEYLVVPVKSGTPRSSRDKLMGAGIKVIEVDMSEVNSPDEADKAIERAVINQFGRPIRPTRYLILNTDDASLLTVNPTVETWYEGYKTYADL